MIDQSSADPFSLTWWRTNLIAEDPVKTVWLMCAIASLVYGADYVDVIEQSMPLKPVPRA
jgi:hypothetical protein